MTPPPDERAPDDPRPGGSVPGDPGLGNPGLGNPAPGDIPQAHARTAASRDTASPSADATAVPPAGDPPSPQGRLTLLRQYLASIPAVGWVKAAGIIAVAGLVVWVTLGILRAPQTQTPIAAWNDSISKLGILPLYPPQEDFHVGDIWAKLPMRPGTSDYFIGIRIGRIELADDIRGSRAQTPFFSDTPAKIESHEYRQIEHDIPLNTVDPARIPVSLVSFPGFQIRRTVQAATGLGAIGAAIGASGEEAKTEEVDIPIAATYGAPVVAAFGKMKDWCQQEDNGPLCTDAGARRLLSYVDDRVLQTRDGAYVYPIELQTIYRVYLAPEIKQRLLEHDGRAVTGSYGSPSTAGATSPQDPAPPMEPNGTEGGETAAEVVAGTPAAIARQQMIAATLADTTGSARLGAGPSRRPA